jgi:hypothetical protein
MTEQHIGATRHRCYPAAPPAPGSGRTEVCSTSVRVPHTGPLAMGRLEEEIR